MFVLNLLCHPFVLSNLCFHLHHFPSTLIYCIQNHCYSYIFFIVSLVCPFLCLLVSIVLVCCRLSVQKRLKLHLCYCHICVSAYRIIWSIGIVQFICLYEYFCSFHASIAGLWHAMCECDTLAITTHPHPFPDSRCSFVERWK